MQALLLTKKPETFAGLLDVRLKIFFCIAGSLCSIYFNSPYSLGILLLGSVTLALTATKVSTLTKVVLGSIVMMCISFGLTALLSLAIPNLIRWNPLSLSVPFLRMLVVVNLLMALALSSPVQEVFARLRSSFLPSWISIPLLVAIRFIPTFMEDCKQIADANRLRRSNGIFGLWRAIVVPLIFRVLYSANELALAAELKGMETKSDLKNKETFQFSTNDARCFLFALVIIGIALSIQVFGPQFGGMHKGG